MSDILKITLLGTGVPVPKIQTFSTATLVEAGGRRFLLDCGRGAAMRLWQLGIGLGQIEAIFFSHFHSDHYAGLFDLQMTGAIPFDWGGRKAPLPIYGPTGIKDVAEGLWQAAKPDRDIRVADSEIDPEMHRLVPHEYTEGILLDEDGLKITAILVDHGDFVKPAYAFRVDYKGRSFVHSHDTRYNENLIAQSQGVDVMVHEVGAAHPDTLAQDRVANLVIAHHATPPEVGRVFDQVRPKLALLTHLVLMPPNPPTCADVLTEIAEEYDGTVVVAEDLMTILIGKSVSVLPNGRGSP